MISFDAIKNAINDLAEISETDSDKFTRILTDVAKWWKRIVEQEDERR